MPFGHVDLAFFVFADSGQAGERSADSVVRILGENRFRIVGELVALIGFVDFSCGVDDRGFNGGGFCLRLFDDLSFDGVCFCIGRYRDRFCRLRDC